MLRKNHGALPPIWALIRAVFEVKGGYRIHGETVVKRNAY
jgi:hypothetical protein